MGSVPNDSSKDDYKKMPKSKLDKIGLLDAFAFTDVVVQAVQSRIKKITDEKSFHDIIKASVDHFEGNLRAEVAKLKKLHEDRPFRI